MRERWTDRLLVAVLVTAGLVVPAGAAQAQSCAAVVDETGEVDTDRVEVAVADLAGQADAKVYVFQSVPDGDLGVATDELIEECFSDGPDGRQFDLVLITISLDDRMTFLQYGGAHNLELADEESIRENDINPRLADGDITGGILAGLEAIDDRLDPDAALTDGVAVDADPDPASSTDGDSFPWSALVLGGGAVAGLGGLAVSRRRRLVAARNQLEFESQQPRVQVGATRERFARLQAQAEVWERIIEGRTRQDLLSQLADGRQAASETERSVSLFDQATPDGIAEASNAQVAMATSRLRELEFTLERTNDALDRVEFLGGKIDRLRVTLPRKRQQLDIDAGEALDLAAERAGAGWKVDELRSRLEAVRVRLGELSFDELRLDLFELSAVVEEAEAELFSVRHDLQTLEDTLESLQTWAAQLAESEAAERSRIDATRQELADIGRIHAPESWRWAGDNIDGALVALDQGNEHRSVAVDQLIPAQDWTDAGGSLETAGLHLIEADDLLDEIDALFVSLHTAREHAAAVLTEASLEVDQLRGFVQRHDHDLTARFDVEPDEAAIALAGLRAELERPLPNYLRVAQTGDRLARRIDTLFDEAREEQARVEALRREIAREEQRARREIERAERAIGWELIASRASKELDQVQRELQQPSATLEEALRRARQAADDAIGIRSDVIQRRRRNNTWVIVGGSSGGFGGGGGGTSSGGGFGGGFGGGGFGGGGGGGFGGGGGGGSW